MKKNKVYILLYGDIIYIKVNDLFESIKVKDELISNGRINDIDGFLNTIKKSNYLKKSFYKIVEDNLFIIYFGDYNTLEINNIKKILSLRGYNIKLIDYTELLNKEYDYLFLIKDRLYGLANNKKISMLLENFNFKVLNANSKIIINKNIENIIINNTKNGLIYVVDDLPRYIFNTIC